MNPVQIRDGKNTCPRQSSNASRPVVSGHFLSRAAKPRSCPTSVAAAGHRGVNIARAIALPATAVRAVPTTATAVAPRPAPSGGWPAKPAST